MPKMVWKTLLEGAFADRGNGHCAISGSRLMTMPHLRAEALRLYRAIYRVRGARVWPAVFPRSA
jgi:hypothetical protein